MSVGAPAGDVLSPAALPPDEHPATAPSESAKISATAANAFFFMSPPLPYSFSMETQVFL